MLNDKTQFSKLQNGIFFAYQNKVIREPEYEVINSFTDKSSALSKMHQYSSDMEKIIREMDYAYNLIDNLPEEKYLEKLRIAPEDYILYHKGYFLELVHQMKDKVFNLIDAFSKINEKKYEEKKTNVKIGDIIKRDKISNHQDLIKLINEWGENAHNPISLLLKKRTKNHHSRSDLHLAPSYQDIKVSRLFEDAQKKQTILSDYGVEQMKIRKEKGFNEWHKDSKEMMLNTKNYIRQNIELISKQLTCIFNLQTLQRKKEIRIVLQEYNRPSAKEICNNTSQDKLSKSGVFYIITQAVEIILKELLGKELISYYIIGSVARGQPKLGISDLNLVVVTKNIIPGLLEVIQEPLIDAQLKNFSKILFYIDIKVLSKKQFFSIDSFKTAFSCKYDGFLFTGEDLLVQKKFPRPGLGLAYVLNKDFKNEIEKTRRILKAEKELRNDMLMRLVRKTAKDSLRMLFGEVMANHTLYAVEMQRIKDLLIWAHHSNWQIIARFYYFLRYANIVTNKESLETMINFFCIEKLYPLLDDLENKSKNWFDEWHKKY